jgi:hypothetical protein
VDNDEDSGFEEPVPNYEVAAGGESDVSGARIQKVADNV